MKKIQKINIFLWCFLFFIFAIIIMAKDIELLPEEQSQIDFCNVITTYLHMYKAELDKDYYMDHNSNLKAIYDERTNQLKTVLKNGKITFWKGKITNITVFDDKEVKLSVQLSCNSSLKSNMRISIKSPLYQKLRKYSENAKIIFSGNFLLPPNKEAYKYPYKVYYGETSWTTNGSMYEPVFYFKFTQFHDD